MGRGFYVMDVCSIDSSEIKQGTQLKKLAWRSNSATWNFFDITFNVDKGGTFKLKEDHVVRALSHYVWVNIKHPIIGRFVEMFFKYEGK